MLLRRQLTLWVFPMSLNCQKTLWYEKWCNPSLLLLSSFPLPLAPPLSLPLTYSLHTHSHTTHTHTHTRFLFLMLCYMFRVLCFGLLVLCLGFWVLCSVFCVLRFVFWCFGVLGLAFYFMVCVLCFTLTHTHTHTQHTHTQHKNSRNKLSVRKWFTTTGETQALYCIRPRIPLRPLRNEPAICHICIHVTREFRE